MDSLVYQDQLRKESGCSGKESYSSQNAAEAARVFYLKHGVNFNRTSDLVSYCCEFCGEWHIGHEKRRTH
jgi:hypothetical protein